MLWALFFTGCAAGIIARGARAAQHDVSHLTSISAHVRMTVVLRDLSCRPAQPIGTHARRAQPSAVQVLLNGEAGRSDAGDAPAPARVAGGAAGDAGKGPQGSMRRVQLLQPLNDSPPVPGAPAQQQARARFSD